MPSGKKLRTSKPEPEEPTESSDGEAVVEEPAEAVEAVEPTRPTVEETTVEEPAAKEERKRGFLRRRKDKPEAAAADAAVTTEAETPVEDASDDKAPVADDEAGVAEDDAVLVPHRPAGKRLKIAAAAAAALFVAGGAFLGATAQPVIANNALVKTKLNIARTAASAITTLWSYTPENMDSLGQRSAGYLTGDFAFQYKKFIDSIVATNKQAQVTNTTTVLGTAVESVTPTDASAVVYTNSVATSPVSKNIPSLRYLSYRLEMKRDRTDWRITRMTTVTTLDLTPQL
jgi:Mce-associated membrane protein